LVGAGPVAPPTTATASGRCSGQVGGPPP